MKNILRLFLVTQILYISNACAIQNTEIPSTSLVSVSGDFLNGYMKYSNCSLNYEISESNEYLYINDTPDKKHIYKPSYEADSGKCANNTQVCILGYSTVANSLGTNQCWKSVVEWDGDYWKTEKQMPDCSGSPWTPKTMAKTAVFVTKYNQIVVFGGVIQTLVGFDPIKDYNLDCVAYICINPDDDKFSYGCPDGSCPDIGTDCPSTEDDHIDTPAGTEDDATSAPFIAPTPPPVSEVVHRNTIQPYLDALKIKCPSVGK